VGVGASRTAASQNVLWGRPDVMVAMLSRFLSDVVPGMCTLRPSIPSLTLPTPHRLAIATPSVHPSACPAIDIPPCKNQIQWGIV
jgi:hypothetical protein